MSNGEFMKNDMNDDFLHRLRVEPSRQFLSALKASLDRQALSQRKARRTLFRTAILAALIGGSAVAVAFVAWRGVPTSLRIAAHVASANPPTQSRIIISAPSGGGAAMPNARTSGEGAAMPLGSVPPPSPDAGAGARAATAAGANQSRTVFSVAGPTAVILNAQSVVRRPVETKMLQQPVFTLASSNDAIAMLCHVH
ncbi:MAG TPA: hypothetical protein VHS76_13695, partial [Steroidobacteraceae bacterium]|nr:hypothetical protein [Steroidobacteraceae bacterium]